MSTPGYWPSPWPGEDGGPARPQEAPAAAAPRFDAGSISVVHREAVATTMVVLREPGEVFALHHTAGPDAIAWVARVDPDDLRVLERSPDLPGGPTWPGGLAAHEDGSIYVVFGNHAHRLDRELRPRATRRLPRSRPYNSFVILPDGCLATKDFGGMLPGSDPESHRYDPCELVVLEPGTLDVRARCEIPEASIARLSADGDRVYVVGTESLFRVVWDGAQLVVDPTFEARYRTLEGQSYGWDPVIGLDAVWFLDNGFGAERYDGTFRGRGINAAPLHLVRVDLDTAAVSLTEICGLANGVVANPPLVDERRRIVVGFDSGNGVLAGFDVAPGGGVSRRWRRDQNHAAHLLLFEESGELVTTDHDASAMRDDLVIVDIESGTEHARVASGSPLQSVVFPAAGWDHDVYYCSFSTLARMSTAG